MDSINRAGVLGTGVLATGLVVSFAAFLISGSGCASNSGGLGRVAGSLEEDGGEDAATDGGGGGEEEDGGGSGDDGSTSDDASVEPSCDLTKPFLPPTVVPGFDTRDVYSARFAADEKSALLSIANGATGVDLFNASRATTSDPITIGSAIDELNTAGDEYWPSLSADGKMLFFESARELVPGEPIAARIWTATRASVGAVFGAPTVLGAFRVDGSEGAPYVLENGRSLYFMSGVRGGAGDLDVFVASFTNFGVVTSVSNVAPANSNLEESMPVVSRDERALFFARFDATSATRDIWVVGRSHSSSPFGVAQQVVEASSQYDEYPSSISSDSCRLYFISNRPVDSVQRYRVWVAAKPL